VGTTGRIRPGDAARAPPLFGRKKEGGGMEEFEFKSLSKKNKIIDGSHTNLRKGHWARAKTGGKTAMTDVYKG